MERRQLTQRPYSLQDLFDLLAFVRRLKEKDFPATQLFALREVLEEGREQATLHFLYQYSRAKAGSNIKELLNDFWSNSKWCDKTFVPWHSKAQFDEYREFDTPIADIVEIYDFVPKGGKWIGEDESNVSV